VWEGQPKIITAFCNPINHCLPDGGRKGGRHALFARRAIFSIEIT